MITSNFCNIIAKSKKKSISETKFVPIGFQEASCNFMGKVPELFAKKSRGWG